MKLRMTVQHSPRRRDDFQHPGPVILIGRNPDCQLVLDGDAVSWDHAKIEMSPYQATVTDLGSTNGTLKNGQRISAGTPLWPGDTIQFGQTGPTLTIVELDLTSTEAMPPPIPFARAAKPAKPVISETRGIAMQAVKELMTQQEELRTQHAAHSRHKKTFTTVALTLLALLLLLGGTLFVFRDSLLKRTEDLSGGLTKLGESVDETRAEMGRLTSKVSDGFARVDREFEAEREKDKQTDAKLAELALNAARQEAAARGIPDRIKDLGVSLEQLNDRLAKGAGGNPVDRPNAAPPAVRPPAVRAAAKTTRIEPGQKVDVILKDNQMYSGSLISIDNQVVKVQTIPDPKAPPTIRDIRKVQAFQTRDGIFAFNESTGEFESAITFFRFNKANQKMERIEESQDTYMAQPAKIYGATSSVVAMLSVGPTGEWCVGLPLPASRSPDSLDAYHFKEIVTSKGVYAYDQSGQNFVYKSHIDLAKEAKAANDQGWADYTKRNWDKRVQEFELGTKRLEALAPLFWRPWRWW